MAVFVKYKRYSEGYLFLTHQYLVPENNKHGGGLRDISIFYSYCQSLEDVRKKRLGLRWFSITANTIQERATISAITFNDLMQADAVLLVSNFVSGSTLLWAPITLFYAQRLQKLELFLRATSSREFRNISALFGVSSKQEFLTKFEAGAEVHHLDKWSEFTFNAGISIRDLLNLQELATKS